MLVSFLKSYKRGIFTTAYPCPQSEQEIAAFVEILLPIYSLNIDLQHTIANISLVAPCILAIIYTLGKLQLTNPAHNEFRKNLISHVKVKFSAELSSNVYSAAAALNVEAFGTFRKRSFGKEYAATSETALVEVLTLFAPTSSEATPDVIPISPNHVAATGASACLEGCAYMNILLRTTSVVLDNLHELFYFID